MIHLLLLYKVLTQSIPRIWWAFIRRATWFKPPHQKSFLLYFLTSLNPFWIRRLDKAFPIVHQRHNLKNEKWIGKELFRWHCFFVCYLVVICFRITPLSLLYSVFGCCYLNIIFSHRLWYLIRVPVAAHSCRFFFVSTNWSTWFCGWNMRCFSGW